MKKKISIVFTAPVSPSLVPNLTRDLRLVFGDAVEISVIYSSELRENEQLDSDVILIMRPGIMKLLQNHLPDPGKVVLVTRTISEDAVYQLYDIPTGSRVLVVNDSRETTADTVAMLCQLGIAHLELIPYLDPEADFSDIQFAVTPGEARMVPPSIPNIIDIGDRRLDMQTFLDMLPLLNLNSDSISQALIRYSENKLELHTGIKKRYIQSYMLSETLTQILSLQKSGIIVTDVQYHISYWNTEAERILEKTPGNHLNLSLCLPADIAGRLTAPSFTDDLFTLGGTSYMISRIPLHTMGQVSGYCLTFESASQIRKSGSELSRKLRNQGLLARYYFHDIIYKSPAMEHCITLAKRVAASDYTVLITGETGTGKELFAQAIHNYSPRKNNPFVAVNCAALPESLLESELFGYEEGAFTGARRGGKMGLFEQADGGTLFLDEIGDMPYSLQSRLLRVLQEQQIVRIGGGGAININVRVLTATNCNLMELTKEKKFREDLFFRLNVFPLSLPPLRLRKEDIIPLFSFLSGIEPQALEPQIKNRLLSYRWPGNVRELRNAANYYQLMGNLECLPAAEEPQTDCMPVDATYPARITAQILDIVGIFNGLKQTIGRTGLIEEMQKRGFTITQKQMEYFIKMLLDSGYITRSRGRSGIHLTESGKRHSNNAGVSFKTLCQALPQ